LYLDIDSIVQKMDRLDSLTSMLSAVHDDFRLKASQIPIYWQLNEDLLRRLMQPSAGYDIMHPQRELEGLFALISVI